jgi:hypothetical protein
MLLVVWPGGHPGIEGRNVNDPEKVLVWSMKIALG